MIQFYHNGQQGSPQTGASAGQLVALLDAVLVNGYGQVNVSTITRDSTIATVTTATAHGLDTFSTCEIANCNQDEYNGKFYVTSVPDTTHLTYTVAGNPATPATTGSTITCKRASLGWSKPFAATNYGTYRAPVGVRHYLAVDNTAGGAARVRGIEVATGVGVYGGQLFFPWDYQIGGGLYWPYRYADGYAGPWQISGNEKIFYLLTQSYHPSYGVFYYGFVFGEFNSYKPNDAYNTVLLGSSNGYLTGGVGNLGNLNTSGSDSSNSYTWIARNVNGAAAGSTGVARGCDSWRSNQSGGPASSLVFSNTEGGYNFSPIWLSEGSNGVRGYLPGVYALLHPTYTFSYGTYLTIPMGSALAGKTFYVCPIAQRWDNYYRDISGTLMFEISSTWS